MKRARVATAVASSQEADDCSDDDRVADSEHKDASDGKRNQSGLDEPPPFLQRRHLFERRLKVLRQLSGLSDMPSPRSSASGVTSRIKSALRRLDPHVLQRALVALVARSLRDTNRKSGGDENVREPMPTDSGIAIDLDGIEALSAWCDSELVGALAIIPPVVHFPAAVWSHVFMWCNISSMYALNQTSRAFRHLTQLPGSWATVVVGTCLHDSYNRNHINRFLYTFPAALRSAAHVVLQLNYEFRSVPDFARYACHPARATKIGGGGGSGRSSRPTVELPVKLAVPVATFPGINDAGVPSSMRNEIDAVVSVRPNTVLQHLDFACDLGTNGADFLSRVFPSLASLRLRCSAAKPVFRVGALARLVDLRALELVHQYDDDDDFREWPLTDASTDAVSLPRDLVRFAVLRDDDRDMSFPPPPVAALDAVTGNGPQVWIDVCARANPALTSLHLDDCRVARLKRLDHGESWPALRHLELGGGALATALDFYSLMRIPTLETLTLRDLELPLRSSLLVPPPSSSSSSSSFSALSSSGSGESLRMRQIDLDRCHVSNELIRDLLAAYPNLVALRVDTQQTASDEFRVSRMLADVANSAAFRNRRLKYLQAPMFNGATFGPPHRVASPSDERLLSAAKAKRNRGPTRAKKAVVAKKRQQQQRPQPQPPSASTNAEPVLRPDVAPPYTHPLRPHCRCQSRCRSCVCVQAGVSCDSGCHIPFKKKKGAGSEKEDEKKKKASAALPSGVKVCRNVVESPHIKRAASLLSAAYRPDATQCRLLVVSRALDKHQSTAKHLRASAILVVPRPAVSLQPLSSSASSSASTPSSSSSSSSLDAAAHVMVARPFEDDYALTGKCDRRSRLGRIDAVATMDATIYTSGLARLMGPENPGDLLVGFGWVAQKQQPVPSLERDCSVHQDVATATDSAAAVPPGPHETKRAERTAKKANTGGAAIDERNAKNARRSDGADTDDDEKGEEDEEVDDQGIAYGQKNGSEDGVDRYCLCRAPRRVWTDFSKHLPNSTTTTATTHDDDNGQRVAKKPAPSLGVHDTNLRLAKTAGVAKKTASSKCERDDDGGDEARVQKIIATSAAQSVAAVRVTSANADVCRGSHYVDRRLYTTEYALSVDA